MQVTSRGDMLRIYFTPQSPELGHSTFVDLKVANFTAKNGFRIRVPGVLQMPAPRKAKDDRVDITFYPSLGGSLHLKTFIFDALKQTVLSWATFKDAFEWFAHAKVWKKQIILEWQKKQRTSLPCNAARICSENVLQYIPVNLLSGRCTITLRRIRNLTGHPQLYLRVPGQLTNTHTRKKSHLQRKFMCEIPGGLQQFSKFVADYVHSVVLNWTSLEEAKTWATKLPLFIQLVTHAWCKCYENIFWEIKPSKAANVDLSQGPVPLGSGLFCTKRGKHRIHFGNPPLSHWIKTRLEENSLQSRYALGGKDRPGFTYFLPTEESFETGIIHHGFKVNHSKKPTHLLHYEKTRSFYWLEPINETNPGDEFTFDYNLADAFERTT